MNYQWKILEIFANGNELISVKYLLSVTDNTNIVETEGNHTFLQGTVKKPLDQIVESDIIQWLEKDTTVDDVNPIKLATENQLKSLKISEKVVFPWLSDTFTIE